MDASGVEAGAARRGLLGHDPFFVLADDRAHVDAQREVEAAWRDVERWTRASILSTARMGFLSSDRSIRNYARDIWRVIPVPVPPNGEEPQTEVRSAFCALRGAVERRRQN